MTLSLVVSLLFKLGTFCYGKIEGNLEDEWIDVSFSSNWDNTTQYYVKKTPDNGLKSQTYDIIVGLHGHGSDRWQFALDERSECAAFRDFAKKYGMIAVSPDYRAKTSWMGPAAESDLLQIIGDLKSTYSVNRVFLVGGSMGASSALTFAVLHPVLISGVVAMNGHANHLEFNGFQDAIADSFGGSKRNNPMEYKKRSAEYWPEQLTMPVAFTVGINDSIVPPCSIIRLSGILNKLGVPSLMVVDEEGGHETNYENALSAMEFIMMGGY